MPAIYCNIHQASYMDSCDQCEDANPVWQRTMTIYFDVEDQWLDPDGLGDHDESWYELRREVIYALEKQLYRYGYKRGQPTFDVDWEDKPERAR